MTEAGRLADLRQILPLDAIREYNKLAAIPADQFPGHRAMALTNLVAYIGERVIALVNAEASRLLGGES